MMLFKYSKYESYFICIFTAFPDKRKKFLRHMGKRVILFPNESIGCIRIRMLYFTDADFLVLCHCGQVMENGFDAYMAKPINANQLRTQISAILKQHIIFM